MIDSNFLGKFDWLDRNFFFLNKILNGIRKRRDEIPTEVWDDKPEWGWALHGVKFTTLF